MKKLFALFLVAISVGVFAQESVLLRMKYVKGEHQDIEVKMKQTMSVGMEIQTNMLLKNNIVEVKENEFVVESQINKISTDVNYMGNVVSYSSSLSEQKMDSTQKIIHAKMKPLLNSIVLSYYTNLGKLLDTKLKSGDANIEEIMQNAPKSIVYPTEKVKVGSIWTNEEKTSNGIEMKKTYTVTKIDKDFIYLKFLGQISGVAEGKINGEAIIKKETGVLFSSKSSNTITTMGNEVKTEATITVK